MSTRDDDLDIFKRYWTGGGDRGPAPLWFRVMTLALVGVGALVAFEVGWTGFVQAIPVGLVTVVLGQFLVLRMLTARRRR